MEISIVKISQMKMIVTVFYVDHPSTLVLMTLQPAFSQRNSAMGEGTVQMGLMKAISVVLRVSLISFWRLETFSLLADTYSSIHFFHLFPLNVMFSIKSYLHFSGTVSLLKVFKI